MSVSFQLLRTKVSKLFLIKIYSKFTGPALPKFPGQILHIDRGVKFVNNFQPKKGLENIFKSQDA